MVKQAVSIERYDENGYPRGKLNHSDLLHRQIAYNEIYLKDREKYPEPFSKYVVHHKDKDKENFNPENLQLLTREEHERLHKLPSKNQVLKEYYSRKEMLWKIEQNAKEDRERFLREREKERQDKQRREEMKEQNKKEWEEKKARRKWKWLNLIGIQEKKFNCLDCGRKILRQGRCLICNKKRKKERGE